MSARQKERERFIKCVTEEIQTEREREREASWISRSLVRCGFWIWFHAQQIMSELYYGEISRKVTGRNCYSLVGPAYATYLALIPRFALVVFARERIYIRRWCFIHSFANALFYVSTFFYRMEKINIFIVSFCPLTGTITSNCNCGNYDRDKDGDRRSSSVLISDRNISCN